jgi:FkbM family methyltransferase
MKTVKSLHYRLTELASRAGADSVLVRLALRGFCRGVSLGFSKNHIDIVQGTKILRIASRHFPYAIDMARYFDHYFSQVVSHSEEGFAVVDYSQPRAHRYSKSGLEFEFSSLAEEIDVIEEYFRWYRPQPGDTVFDIGAYCGASAHYLSSLVGQSGKVYAFEPDPLNFSLLQRNIARHRLTNVIPVQIALAGTNGETEFFSEGALGSTIAEFSRRAPAGTRVRIETMTFADACTHFGVPSYAKVDIEGAEIALFTSAAEFLCSYGIHFAIDTNHYCDGALTAKPVEAIFQRLGYHSESSDRSGFMTTWASPPEAKELKPWV